ncbi:hypothetical protein EAY04_23150, partial [Vibrio anguillarum]
QADNHSGWFYKNGGLVPESELIILARKCKVDEAANWLANVKEGEFEDAFASYMEAITCMTSSGIVFKN